MGVMIGAGKAVHADGNGAGEGATLCGMGATISRGTSADVTCKRCVKMIAAQPAPVFTGDPLPVFDAEERSEPLRPAPLPCGCSPLGAHHPLCNAMKDVTCGHDFAGFALCQEVKGHSGKCRDMWGHTFPNPAAIAVEREAEQELADGALSAAGGDYRDASRRLWAFHDAATVAGEDRAIRIAVGALSINGRREWRAEKDAAASRDGGRIEVCRFKASKARRGNSKPRKLATR